MSALEKTGEKKTLQKWSCASMTVLPPPIFVRAHNGARASHGIWNKPREAVWKTLRSKIALLHNLLFSARRTGREPQHNLCHKPGLPRHNLCSSGKTEPTLATPAVCPRDVPLRARRGRCRHSRRLAPPSGGGSRCHLRLHHRSSRAQTRRRHPVVDLDRAVRCLPLRGRLEGGGWAVRWVHGLAEWNHPEGLRRARPVRSAGMPEAPARDIRGAAAERAGTEHARLGRHPERQRRGAERHQLRGVTPLGCAEQVPTPGRVNTIHQFATVKGSIFMSYILPGVGTTRRSNPPLSSVLTSSWTRRTPR